MFKKAKSLYHDPLVGCNPTVLNSISPESMSGFLLTRLRIVFNRRLANNTMQMIYEQALKIGIDFNQYVSNELQYEIRAATLGRRKFSTPEFETIVLRNWAKFLSKDYNPDFLIEFVAQVNKNREYRAANREIDTFAEWIDF